MAGERVRMRFFTPEEANALLPELSRLLEGATTRARRYQELVSAMRGGHAANAEARQDALREANELRREALELLEDIAEKGVEVKGLEQGLLDFPAQRNGQEVYLCWQRGEPAVAHWHPITTGFSARKPIDDGVWEWCN